MNIETERRFLVKNNQWMQYVVSKRLLRQGYLSINPNKWAIRIRIDEAKNAWLTMKYPLKECSSYEFEYSIPIDDAEAIWKLISQKVIKTRFELDLEGRSWVVDRFQENNSPLVVAEVEIKSPETQINIPHWCGKEISGLRKWSNAALAQRPYSQWSIDTSQKGL